MSEKSTEEANLSEGSTEWEDRIFARWRDAGYFDRTPGFGEHGNDSYTVVIPPPNITGVLHMGHALNDTIQDACIRRARMRGYQTRWVLGTDHAGIATQTKVDKHLAEQGINRREIGREAFIEECQRWRDEYGTTIVNQIKAMGASCDYDNEQFTMSPEFSLAVRKVFVDWYENGIIYRGRRIVNWCPNCTTAIADDEAEYEDEASHLWYLRYPLAEPVDGIEYVVVATTRPETMLGDTGVAVSPSDERYANIVGKDLILPIVDRRIPVFTDFHVDASYGTGAVKVTPAHDPNDHAMGQRHDLEQINIFDETATVVDGFGRFSGMTREEAREAIVEEFEELGLLDHIEDLNHSVMHCYRCHTTLEPWLSEQWFVSVDQLKEAARKAVADGQIEFYPSRWAQVYLDWLENLKDWCISRQLWWGHRIPMFYCDECGWEGASVDQIEVCPVCGKPVRQDEDVLDTWFSSQLWPFATQGWALGGKDAEELVKYYPTQMLSTARDIMGLWVARMVMASEYFMGQIPFADVIIHPTVMGADGKPMSKSRGNGVDPMELIANFGADGMRFGLLAQVTGTQAIRFDVQRIENARNFANKVRNAAKFVVMNLGDTDMTAGDKIDAANADPRDISDKWILSRLAKLVAAIDTAYDGYEFAEISQLLYSFFWNEFCDWYIEFSKARLAEDADPADREACRRNLIFVLDAAIRLLHPAMPFITEQIYDDLPKAANAAEMLIVAPWPDADNLAALIDEDAEAAVSATCDVVSAIRSARSRYGVSPKAELAAVVKASADKVELLESQRQLIESLAKTSSLSIGTDVEKPAESVVTVVGEVEVYVVLSGLVDFEAEKSRLKKEIDKLSKDAAKFEKKLSNPGFLAKAAPEVIEKDKAKLADITSQLEMLQMQLSSM